jgi:alpha-L-rhamnosidase
MYLKHIICFIFIVNLLIHSKAQPIYKTNWQALWIGTNAPTIPNTFTKYRYDITLDVQPKKALVAIAVDSKYWLWINGKLVVFEGQLKRGPTPNDTYYDELDLAPYLQKGNNAIALLVWYWGKDGFCHKSSGKAGLLFELALDNTVISSSDKWKVQQHLAYQNSSAPHPNFRLPEHNIRYDARLDNEDWIQPQYNTTSWKNAIILGQANAAPWYNLCKRPIPLWNDGGLVAYENALQVEKGVATMKLPKNISITPYFKIEAEAGLLIEVKTDNYYGGNAPNVRTEYITKQGVQEFETPAFMNGHEVLYTFPEGVKVLEVKYRETKYNTKHVGYFTANDDFFNTLFTKSATTLNINMRDAIQDSPDRERAQWWGDVVIVLEEIFYSCDNNGKAAIQKAISNLLEWQKPDGVLFSPIPAGNWDKELPAQMLASVGKYGIWKYIEMSGDTAMIRYAYPFIKKYMSLWNLNEKGLVQHRDGGWSWHDWGNKIDEPLLDNAWYYMALESCYNMASYLKLTEEAKVYKNTMATIATNYQKYFWRGNRFVSDEYKYYADDRGNGLAVCAGLATKQQFKALRPMLDTTYNAGPYLEKYILESYFIMHDATNGLQRMKQRYASMVQSKLSTLWEGWEIGSATYGGGTYNHGWTGGPLSLMSGYVAGIRNEGLGFERYSITPQLGNLEKIHCGTNTTKGFIKVDIDVLANKIALRVETIDAKGLIALPKLSKPFSLVTINGKKKLRQMKRLHEDDAYVYFSCKQKGIWNIVGSL